MKSFNETLFEATADLQERKKEIDLRMLDIIDETENLQEEKKKIDQKIMAIRKREIERGNEIMEMCCRHPGDVKSAKKSDPETGAPIYIRTCPGFAHFTRRGQIVDSYVCAACQKFR